jgi:hypothetical protein
LNLCIARAPGFNAAAPFSFFGIRPTLFRWTLYSLQRGFDETLALLDYYQLIVLDAREALDQSVGPMNFKIGASTFSQTEVESAIIHRVKA